MLRAVAIGTNYRTGGIVRWLERLVGSRRGQHSIRINQQYRIWFRWEAGYADEVEVTDYH